MTWFEALILGAIQGLTEFLPVSSSGHIEIGKYLFQIDAESSLIFTIAVHGATVLSTIVVFWRDIVKITRETLRFQWNESSRFVSMILFSMVPAGIIGLFFKDQVELLFTANMILVGSCLLVTAILLFLTMAVKKADGKLTFLKALIIGISQAVAILPGLSRSGATISTALYLNVDRGQAARFSFLMVIIPILGENILDMAGGNFSQSGIQPLPLIIGTVTAFVFGLLACSWMINIVRKGKLYWFAIYCVVIGSLSLYWGLW